MNNGAAFYKADLHIHSYGKGMGSFDVTDVSNTPTAIVDTAIQKGLKIISVTDHNEIMNSIIAVQYSADKDLMTINLYATKVSLNVSNMLMVSGD